MQSSITPVKASRPPPPEIKPSAAMLGNARDARKPPGIKSYKLKVIKQEIHIDNHTGCDHEPNLNTTNVLVGLRLA